jgi:1-acyl-sn-glycerol-3-phosphate acyltransferase
MQLKRTFNKWFFFRLLGWRIEGEFPFHIPKYVIVVAPHTSNWDVMLGIFCRNITGLKASFVGKKELFFFPLGILIRSIGGLPVNRGAKTNFVDEVVKLYESMPNLVIALAPEGTRKRTDKLKSGFYYIAQKANIQILPVGLDYKNKRVLIDLPRNVAETFDEESAKLMHFFGQCTGKNPSLDLRR